MTKKIGFHLRTWTSEMMRGNMMMEDMNMSEVEKQRDPKGRTWIPIGEQANRERKWVSIEDGAKKKEWTWISIEVNDDEN